MSKSQFVEITAEVIANDHHLAGYLRGGEIKLGNKGGTFVGNRSIAPEEFQKYGICLPKGGMIVPEIEPIKLLVILEMANKIKVEREAGHAFTEFSSKNDTQLLLRLIETRVWKDMHAHVFEPLTEAEQDGNQVALESHGGSNPDYFPMWTTSKLIRGTDLSSLVKRRTEDYLLPAMKRVAGKKIGHVFSTKTFRFYPFSVEGVQEIEADYAEALRSERATDIESYKRMLAAGPQNAIVKRSHRSLKQTGLEMFGMLYHFSSERVANEVFARLREHFFVFTSNDEAELATLIVSGIAPETREVEESWTEGPKMRPEGKGRYIGGTVLVTRTFLGRFKIDRNSNSDDPGSHQLYERLRKAHEDGIDILPRMNAGR